jgi:hypothetical protein
MERHSPLTLEQILARLASVLGHKQTGTFYIATDNNTSCRFAVASGKLTHCTHRRDQGNAALQSLLETSGGSCSFSENQSIPFRVDAVIDHQASLGILGIHPILPSRPEPLPQPTIPPEKPAPSPASSRFYRGGHSSADVSPIEPAAPAAEPPVSPRINNRFYRGGG